MCIQIDSRCVLFNVLQAREIADWPVFRSFVAALKARAPRVYVDISDASIAAAIRDNACFFVLEGRSVRRRPSFEPFLNQSFLDATINRHLPAQTRTCLHEASAIACE